jgi:hypothetical protein
VGRVGGIAKEVLVDATIFRQGPERKEKKATVPRAPRLDVRERRRGRS